MVSAGDHSDTPRGNLGEEVHQMARHHHRHSDRRSIYTADSLQSVRARSASPRHLRRPRHRRRRDTSYSPEDYSRRSRSSYRRESHRTGAKKYRRFESPSPSRRAHHRDRRRHQSLGSFEHHRRVKSRTPPSVRRHHSESKGGGITHQLLKILATTAAPKYNNEKRSRQPDSFYTSWILRPRNKVEKEFTSPLIASDMVRRPPSHHLHRAREELEAERLRKIREEVAEAEARRTVAEEEARRVRRQNEMDEAELRRQRTLGQFTDSDRQRRELQLEDRLRQLEDQEYEASGNYSKKPATFTKSCCKSLKIIFGIILGLGLIFVFYLIVSSILGQPVPFDIFSYNVRPDDPFLLDKNNEIIVPNITTNFNENEINFEINSEKYYPNEIDRKDSGIHENEDHIQNGVEFESDNDPDVSDMMADYERIPEDMDHSGKTMYETFEDAPNFPNKFPTGHSTYSFGEPEILPPIRNEERIEHTPLFVNGNEQLGYSDFPQIPKFPRPQQENRQYPFLRKFPPNRGVFRELSLGDDNYVATQSLDDLEEYESPSNEVVTHRPVVVSPNLRRRFRTRYSPTRRVGLPFINPNIPIERQRYSLEKLEKEIVNTAHELGNERSSSEIMKILRSPYQRGTSLPMRPIIRRRKNKGPRERSGENRRNTGKNKLRMNPPPIRPRVARPFPPVMRRPYALARNAPVDGEDLVKSASMNIGAATQGAVRRGPSLSHSPPSEFRYPRHADSIQDIIDYMTTEEHGPPSYDGQEIDRSITAKQFPPDFIVGRQNHVLRPSFITKDGKVKSMPIPRSKRNKNRKNRKSKSKNRRFPHPMFEENADELIFHDDGSISHAEVISKTLRPVKYERSDRYRPPVYGNKDHSDRYRRKLSLDIYPVTGRDKSGKSYRKFEANFRTNDVQNNDILFERERDRKYMDAPKNSDPYSYKENFNSRTKTYHTDKAEGRYDNYQTKTNKEPPRNLEVSSEMENQHTITLHIKLYPQKPEATQKERIDRVDRRVSEMEIPLTRKFSIMDIYSALMEQVKKERPYAQSLVSEDKRADESGTVHLLDDQEKTSLLQSLQNQFKSMNTHLPGELQLTLLSDGDDVFREAVEGDFKYTEGFEVMRVESDTPQAIEQPSGTSTSSQPHGGASQPAI